MTERQRDIETDRQGDRDRETDKQRYMERDRERQRDGEIQIVNIFLKYSFKKFTKNPR